MDNYPDNQVIRVTLNLYYPEPLPEGAADDVTNTIENAIDNHSPDLTAFRTTCAMQHVGEPIIEWTEPQELPVAPFKVWDEYPGHPVEDWQYEVSMNDTRRGYWAWVREQLRQEAELPF